MRALDVGESFVVTRNGVPVGELTPLRKRTFVRKNVLIAAFKNVPAIDYRRLEDLDAFVDQAPEPRG